MPAIGEARGREVVEGFLSAAADRPGHTAIVENGRRLTYAGLRERAVEQARRLDPHPGVVGVPATHSAQTIIDLLAVWIAGGTYCPVDPAFPAKRRDAMLASTGARMLPEAGPRDGLPEDLAYVLFTSGSSGTPKPVLTPHRAIAAAVGSLRDLFDLTPGDRVLQFASLNWDTCLEEILPALTTGASLVLDRDAHSGSFPRWLRMLSREQITVLDLPTAFWHELVTYLVEESAPLPACVRLVIIGGEAASPARLADWRTLDTKHARLLNTYGCTETTLITHAVDLHGPLASTAPDGVPIGRALPHVVEHIDADGELHIGGPGLALGYLGRPETTDERFVTIGGARFFATGDRVRRAPDGTLFHEGRIDEVVKIRGVRVDPAEVEAHIGAHPAVSAVAVTGVQVADHTVLAAYVVPRPQTRTAGLDASIVDYLRSRVPAHLIPSRIRLVDHLARTASGKLDRHRMREALP
jgi:nonribosomal peptide synthetase protein VioO